MVLNDKGDDKDDDVLVTVSDKHLLWEVVELLNDLKLCISSYVNRNQYSAIFLEHSDISDLVGS